MVLTNTITVVRGLLLLVAQLTGAILASFLVSVLLPYEFNVRTTLSSSTSVAQGVFIEMLLTAQLVFTILMLAKEKHRSTHLAPIGIGVALFIAEMVGILFTGGQVISTYSCGYLSILTNLTGVSTQLVASGPASLPASSTRLIGFTGLVPHWGRS